MSIFATKQFIKTKKNIYYYEKNRQCLLVLLFVVVVSLVFYSCEQKTDLNVQNVENKNYLNEIDKCFDTFIHSKLRETSQLATTRHDGKCDKLADDLTDVYINFPDSTDKKYIEEAKLIKTIEDLLKLQHKTAAEFSLKDSSLFSCKIQVSKEAADEAIKPLIVPSKKFLNNRGFSGNEIKDMLKENNATEADLVLLTLVVNEIEMKNQQVAKTASVNTFNILNLFVTPAYANNNLQEKCTTLIKDSYDCAKDILGLTDVQALFAAGCMTMNSIKRLFKKIVTSSMCRLAAVLAVAKFTGCLYEKGYFHFK